MLYVSGGLHRFLDRIRQTRAMVCAGVVSVILLSGCMVKVNRMDTGLAGTAGSGAASSINILNPAAQVSGAQLQTVSHYQNISGTCAPGIPINVTYEDAPVGAEGPSTAACSAGGTFLFGAYFRGTSGTRAVTLQQSGFAASRRVVNYDPQGLARGMGSDIQAKVFSFSKDVTRNQTYVAGYFSLWNGVSVNGLVRLNGDGSMDHTFFRNGAGCYAGATLYNPEFVYFDAATDKIYLGCGYTNSIIDPTGTKYLQQGLFRLNRDGTLDTSFLLASGDGIPGQVYSMAIDSSTGKLYVGGTFTSYVRNGVSNSVSRLIRLLPNGALDSFFPTGEGPSGEVYAVAWDPVSRKVYVGGNFYWYNDNNLYPEYHYIMRVNENGTVDNSFVGTTYGFDNVVYAFALDTANNVIYVGGSFSNYVTSAGTKSQKGLARLALGNGAADTTFMPIGAGYTGGYVTGLALDTANSRLYVGGSFTTYTNGASTAQSGISRLSVPAGTLDAAYSPSANKLYTTYYSSFATPPMLLDPVSGKIHLGGRFDGLTTASGNVPLGGSYARFNTDGTLDSTVIKDGFDSEVVKVIKDSQGRLYVAGGFASFTRNGVTVAQRGLTRLNADGSVDTGFILAGDGFKYNTGNGFIWDIALDATNSKLYVAGTFNSYIRSGSPTTITHLARLNLDGTLDTTFIPATKGTNNTVYSIALLPNGTVLDACGTFSTIDAGAGAITQWSLTRVLSNGTVDTTFMPSGAGLKTGGLGACSKVLLDASNNRLYAGGSFNTYLNGASTTITGLTRFITGTGAIDLTFVPASGGFLGGGASINTLALDASRNRLYAGGSFTSYTNGSATNVTALAAVSTQTGQLDTSFVPANGGTSNWVKQILYEPSTDQIYLMMWGTAAVTTAAGVQTANGLMRLSAGGAPDPTFNAPSGAATHLYELLVDPTAKKMYVYGRMQSYGTTMGSILIPMQLDGSFSPN